VPIRYRVDVTARDGHRGHLSVELDGVASPTIDLVVPSWVPGSYYLVNYVRGFRDVVARAEPDGVGLATERVGSCRWRVRTEGHARIRVDYTVYGHDEKKLVTEAFDLTSEHLFLNPALALPYVDGHQNEPVELELHLPPEWRVVTELEEVRSRPPTFRAKDYDELVDSPLDAGRPVVLTVRPQGIPHRISLCGDGGNYEAHRLEEDLTKIAEASMRLLGDSPLTRYTFFVHLSDVADGGLEHATSNSGVVSRNVFQPQERYERFLSLEAHEYFHLYNVKRIRPKVLMPFDYTREQPTRLLWWMEGTTDYFSDLILRRAGLYTPGRYLEEEAKMAKSLLDSPGRRSLSLEELSQIAWVDHYHPYEETPNQSVSYYIKGHVVSLCLDLEIRHRSETAASLETVLRTLWNEYGKTGRGVGEDELEGIAERATGLDLGEFFARYVRGTVEVDLERFGHYAGLTFRAKPKPSDDTSAVPGYLGIRHQDSGGLPRVQHVLLDTPAHRAGVSPGDEIVAINGSKVTASSIAKDLEGCPPGTPVDLAVFRRGYLRHIALTTGTPPPEKYQFVPDDNPPELAKKVYAAWVGAPWEPPAPGGSSPAR